MIKKSAIEEHQPNGPALGISCSVIVPKPERFFQTILNVRNLNKALIPNNFLIISNKISRQDYTRAQLSGASYFSKLDFKSLNLNFDNLY